AARSRDRQSRGRRTPATRPRGRSARRRGGSSRLPRQRPRAALKGRRQKTASSERPNLHDHRAHARLAPGACRSQMLGVASVANKAAARPATGPAPPAHSSRPARACPPLSACRIAPQTGKMRAARRRAAMNERETVPHGQRPAAPGEGPLMTFVSAAIFLYVGFVLAPVGVSGNAIYDNSVTAFTWMARIVGVGLVIVGLLILMRVPGAGAIDLGASVLATLGCLIPGLIWLAF